jgi:hypothetical protein
MSTVSRLGMRFDPAFDRTGGEDTVFFVQLAQRGATLVWVGAAVVHETPDPERLSLSYVLRRAYRTGAVTVVVERTVGTAPPVRRALRRTGRVGRGLLRVVRGAVAGDQAACALGLADIVFACGWWAAVLRGRGHRRDQVTGRRPAPSDA